MIALCIILVGLLITSSCIIFHFKKKLNRIQSNVYANYDQKMVITRNLVNASIIQTTAMKEPVFANRNRIDSHHLQTEEEKETSERALKRRRALYCQ